MRAYIEPKLEVATFIYDIITSSVTTSEWGNIGVSNDSFNIE